MTRFAPRPTRPTCWRKPCLSSSRPWRLRRTASPSLRRRRSRAPSRARNTAVSSAISASPFSAAARPLLRRGRILTRRPISARRPRRREATRRSLKAATLPPRLSAATCGYPPQPGPWGQPQPPAGGGGFLQNAASTATGVAGGVVLGNLLGGLFGGHGGGGGGLFGGASATGLGGSGLARQSDRGHGDQQLLRRQVWPAAATPTSSSLIPARRAFRTPTSTTSTIRPSTILRPTTAAATTTSEDRAFGLEQRRGVLRASPFSF